MAYVDGFVIPIAKKNVEAYQRLAAKAGRVWMEHGAVGFVEYVGEDLRIKGMKSFLTLTKAKPGETVLFSYIVFKSRAHRDKVNAKAMKDKRLAGMDLKAMPFDVKRMNYGGFKSIVEF
jgi:uncharacterized protein YbaA (DUF1428 family)